MPPSTSDTTVSSLLAAWREAEGPRWSPSTELAHACAIRRLDRGLGHLRLVDLDALVIGQFHRELAAGVHGRPLAPATVHRNHAVLAAALEHARRWGWIEINPARAARPPRPPAHRSHALDPAALLRVVRGIPPESRFGVLVRLAAVTGARRGELCALRANDLDGLKLRIARSISVGEGCSRVEGTTKTGRARTISLDTGTAAVLHGLLELRAASASAGRRRRARDPFIFSAVDVGDRPLAPNSVTAMWHRWKRRIGPDGSLDHTQFGALRHLAVSQMLAASIPITTVAQRVGHVNAATTLRVYGHALPAGDETAADVLACLLG
jgi:integrase